jgi:hypothetical protein
LASLKKPASAPYDFGLAKFFQQGACLGQHRLKLALIVRRLGHAVRDLAKAAQERADFMMIAALDPRDVRALSDFRKRHLQALAELFVHRLKAATSPA